MAIEKTQYILKKIGKLKQPISGMLRARINSQEKENTKKEREKKTTGVPTFFQIST